MLLIISGIYCFAHPVLTFSSLGWIVGVIVILSGFTNFGNWWNKRKSEISNIFDMLSALLTVMIGVLVLLNLGARLFTDVALVALFGLWIIVSGLLRIIASVKIKFSWWGFGVFWGVLLVIIGLYALLHPVVSLISLGWCIAFIFISQGINFTFSALTMKTPKNDGQH